MRTKCAGICFLDGSTNELTKSNKREKSPKRIIKQRNEFFFAFFHLFIWTIVVDTTIFETLNK